MLMMPLHSPLEGVAIPHFRPATRKGIILMELILLGLAGLGGLALLLQSKALPSEADFKKGQEKLAASPDDPDANTTVGKYLAFVLGDYQTAMKFLDKSSDKTLRTLAEHERAPLYTDTAVQKVGMGDEWVVAAKAHPALNKIFYSRASQWYGMAWPTLEGIWKDRTREQLRKVLQNGTVPNPPGATAPTGWKIMDATQKAGATTKASYGGKVSFQILPGKHQGNHYYPVGQVITPVPPGKTYEFSAMVLADGTDSANDQIAIQVLGLGGKNLATQFVSLPMDQPWWQKVDTKFDVPAGAVSVNITSAIGSSSGSIFLDDISLKIDGGKEVLKNPGFEDR